MIAKLEQFVRRLVEDQAFREIAVREPEKAVSCSAWPAPSARAPSSSARRSPAPSNAPRELVVVDPVGDDCEGTGQRTHDV